MTNYDLYKTKKYIYIGRGSNNDDNFTLSKI